MIMKRLFLLAAVAMSALLVRAQEPGVVVYTYSGSETAFVERGADRNFYYLYEGQKMTRMDKDAYLKFLQNNCPEAWASYQKGTKLWKTGWGLFGGGLGVMIAGSVVYGLGANLGHVYYSPAVPGVSYPNYHYNEQAVMVGIGAALIAVGDAAVLGSIPCLIVGGLKRNNTHEVYNQYCSRNATALTFQVQASRNGLGIAMNF